MRHYAALLLIFLSTPTLANKQPNILYIYTDDQSSRTVSSYEDSRRLVETKHIDNLARQGVRFRSMYTGTWCMPSRATFLTGKLQFGIESMRMEGAYPGATYDPKQAPFWIGEFRKAGYSTAHIGKWHTGVDSGFGREWDYQIAWNPPKYPKNRGNYYYDQMISFNGKPATLVGGYATDNYTDWAVDYLKGKGRNNSKPWFLWLCYTGTHGPFTPAPRHDNIVDKNLGIPFPPQLFGPRDGKPLYVKKRKNWLKEADGKVYVRNRPPKNGEWNESVKNYHETALSLDEAVGRLVDTLKKTGQWENTLIIYTSDQGFAWGQHGIQHKVAPYDASLTSPLIFSYPGVIPENKVSNVAVGGHDIVPTLFKYAGIDLPWEMHGSDISPLIQKPDQKSDHSVLLSFTGRSYGSDTRSIPQAYDPNASNINWWVSFRQHNYKYIMNLMPGEIEELYDLELDPQELYNLALDESHKKTLDIFRTKAIAELEKTEAPFLKQIKEWHKN